MMELPCLNPVVVGVGQLSTFHPAPPTTLSISSSSSSSSSTGGCGGGPGSSSGSASGSGSNPGLNARTPLSSIPPPSNAGGQNLLNGSGSNGSIYQIHDGFATVRKRKGPTAASIAMRQQQECYDLAQPASAIVSAMAAAPGLKSNFGHGKRPGSFMQKASFRLGSSKDKNKNSGGGSNGVGSSSSNSNGSTKSGKFSSSNGSASLLSTHPSINLGVKSNHAVNSSKNGFSLIPVRKQSSSSSSGSLSPPATSATTTATVQNSAQKQQHQGNLSPPNSSNGGGGGSHKETMQPSTSSFSGGYCPNSNKGNGLILKDYRRNSVATSSPWETSGSSLDNVFSISSETPIFPNSADAEKPVAYSDIHKARLKPSSSSVSSNNSSLGRRLRRLVLPNRMSVPNNHPSSTSPNGGGGAQQQDLGVGGGGGSNHLLMCKSPSASALSSENGVDGMNNQYGIGGVVCNGGGASMGRLRNSISDNSIVGSSGGPGVHSYHHQQNGIQQNGGHRGELLCHSSNGHSRTFHRSCLLPKAPQLEPVMEDGIPWRQPKKDIPWWEMATRRGRYRSCPILQVSQQVYYAVVSPRLYFFLFTWGPVSKHNVPAYLCIHECS